MLYVRIEKFLYVSACVCVWVTAMTIDMVWIIHKNVECVANNNEKMHPVKEEIRTKKSLFNDKNYNNLPMYREKREKYIGIGM